jgi:hypothetical protein
MGKMANSESELWKLIGAIVEGDIAGVSRQLSASPGLAKASFQSGATRLAAEAFFLDRIGRYIYQGDTALHIAAAAYQTEIVRELLAVGADVHAKNRRGQEALHAASIGSPGSPGWNPSSQKNTIIALLEAGADPNAMDRSGVSPLHKAVRTRCAAAVRTLLDHGADPARPNKNGSTPKLLAIENTGRSGSGSPEAKAEQEKIALILEQAPRML